MLVESYTTYLVLPCTMLIFAIGYHLGSARVKHERKIVLETLSTILQSADELSHNVDSHNVELAAIERTVEDLDVPTEMQKMHQLLLGRINNVISSNKQLKDDLICARYTLDQQARELDQTREEARTDELSQVGNRRAFDEAINYRLSKSKRHGDRFALLVIDVDHFKRINDTHGHQAGDRVVRGVGGTLKECLSPDDLWQDAVATSSRYCWRVKTVNPRSKSLRTFVPAPTRRISVQPVTVNELPSHSVWALPSYGKETLWRACFAERMPHCIKPRERDEIA